mgnify:CR=1 FL=1
MANTVAEFFAENEDVDGFWDALRESCMEPDHEWWEEDEEDGFDAGVRLGRESAAQGKPITEYHHAGTNIFYWIGTEEEVLEKLKDGWEMWQEEHPLPDPEEVRRQELEAKRQKKLAEIEKLQQGIAALDEELA